MKNYTKMEIFLITIIIILFAIRLPYNINKSIDLLRNKQLNDSLKNDIYYLKGYNEATSKYNSILDSIIEGINNESNNN